MFYALFWCQKFRFARWYDSCVSFLFVSDASPATQILITLMKGFEQLNHAVPTIEFLFPHTYIVPPASCWISPNPSRSLKSQPNCMKYISLESKNSDLQDGIAWFGGLLIFVDIYLFVKIILYTVWCKFWICKIELILVCKSCGTVFHHPVNTPAQWNKTKFNHFYASEFL
jgi:hypothetical protein